MCWYVCLMMALIKPKLVARFRQHKVLSEVAVIDGLVAQVFVSLFY